MFRKTRSLKENKNGVKMSFYDGVKFNAFCVKLCNILHVLNYVKFFTLF